MDCWLCYDYYMLAIHCVFTLGDEGLQWPQLCIWIAVAEADRTACDAGKEPGGLRDS